MALGLCVAGTGARVGTGIWGWSGAQAWGYLSGGLELVQVVGTRGALGTVVSSFNLLFTPSSHPCLSPCLLPSLHFFQALFLFEHLPVSALPWAPGWPSPQPWELGKEGDTHLLVKVSGMVCRDQWCSCRRPWLCHAREETQHGVDKGPKCRLCHSGEQRGN